MDNAGMAQTARKPPAIKRQPKSAKAKAEEKLLRLQMGARLKEARTEAGYKTADEFAQAIGIPSGKYRKYERGEAGIPHAAMIVLVQYGISIHYIYMGVGPKLIPEPLRPTG